MVHETRKFRKLDEARDLDDTCICQDMSGAVRLRCSGVASATCHDGLDLRQEKMTALWRKRMGTGGAAYTKRDGGSLHDSVAGWLAVASCYLLFRGPDDPMEVGVNRLVGARSR